MDMESNELTLQVLITKFGTSSQKGLKWTKSCRHISPIIPFLKSTQFFNSKTLGFRCEAFHGQINALSLVIGVQVHGIHEYLDIFQASFI